MAKKDNTGDEDLAISPIFGRELIELRLRRGLTQKQLAEAVSITQSMISRLECGSARPSVELMVRLDRVLALSDTELARLFFGLVGREPPVTVDLKPSADFVLALDQALKLSDEELTKFLFRLVRRRLP